MPSNYHLFLRGEVGSYGFDAGYVSYILDKNKDKEVNVLIDSLGGRVDSALTISSLFKLHGKVSVHFIGMNASAATIAAMGANHVSIDAGALFLVHKCTNLVFDFDWMNADQIEERINQLKKQKEKQDVVDGCIAGTYAKRCKKPKADLLDLMKVGGWLSPQQALEWGFVDEITNLDEDEKPVLTDALASAMCAAGMPLPPLAVRKDSFFDRLKSLFMGAAQPSAVPAQSQPEAQLDAPADNDDGAQEPSASAEVARSDVARSDDSSDQEKGSPVSCPNLASCIIVDAVMAYDGTVTLTVEQIEKIEDAMCSLNSKVAELTASVDDLKKAPAADTSSVTEASRPDDDSPLGDIDEIVSSLAKAFH